MLTSFRTGAILTALTAIWGYAVFSYGGVRSQDWTVCLLAIGLTGLISWLISARDVPIPPLDRPVWIAMILLPCYVALQTIPLPWFLLRVLSPARLELLRSLDPIFPRNVFGGFAAFSVMPSATFGHFLRIGAYSIVFLLVREIMCRLPDRPWVVASPLILIGGLEAVVGLIQHMANPASGIATGTYVNRNHFAGLLEMTFPFAFMYTLVLVQRARLARMVLFLPALLLCVVGASALAMLLGILYSLSRMGFIGAACSFVIMGIFLLRAGLPANVNWVAAGLGIAAVLAFFLVGPPNRLLMRFAELSSGDGLTSNVRMQIWQETLRMITAYPIFGCGLGAYEFAFPKYKASVPFFMTDFAHNDYLQGFAELGLVGFVIVAFLLVKVVTMAIRATSAEAPPEDRALAMASAGAFGAILIHSASDFNLYIPSNALLLAWIGGIAAGFPISLHIPSMISMGGHTVIEVKPVVVR